MTPSCCSRPKASNSPQCSTIFPSEMRNHTIPVNRTSLPVAATPKNSPVCLPEKPHPGYHLVAFAH
jgi:hypothetical protein